MARLPRLIVPGQPHHVILRGIGRSNIFSAPDDYAFYLDKLKDACIQFECDLHAYVLMTNHVHLLLTPESQTSLPHTMQMVGRHYVPYFNRSNDRSGALFESRYRSTVVDSERYLLTCMRYIELNPVRATMVKHPGDYRWSSYGANAGGNTDPLITPHPVFKRLGRTADARRRDYRALFRQRIPVATLDEIRKSTNGGWVLGDLRFKEQIETQIGRRAGPRPRGGFRQNHQ